jgi:2-oxoglutarate ferredoxin oxidoreductase subunit alpha
VLSEDDMKNLTETWGRYLDKDGDGIPYRTLPGNRHPASPYFARGTSHDAYARYTEDPAIWETNMERIHKKFETAKQYLPKPVIQTVDGAKEGLLTFGSTLPAVEEARFLLEKEKGKKTNLLDLKAYPFADEVKDFVQNLDKVYVVEMNRDGQLHQLLTIAMPELATKLVKVAYSDGLPPTARRVMSEILAKEN